MSPTFASLSVRNYRIYATGAFVSNIGTWMGRVAQDWLVLTELTRHSSSALGIVTGLQFLPFLLLAPWTGVVADRFPKRRLLAVTQTALALSSLGLGLVTVTGHAQLPQPGSEPRRAFADVRERRPARPASGGGDHLALAVHGRAIAEQRDQQRIALHLAREWMRGNERIRRLEIGARREHEHVLRTLRRDARHDERQRERGAR